MIRRARCCLRHYAVMAIVRDGERMSIGVTGCPDSDADFIVTDTETDAPHVPPIVLTPAEWGDAHHELAVSHCDDTDRNERETLHSMRCEVCR